jgi:hypothetical protein
MGTTTDAYNAMLEVTLKNYRGKLTDNIFTDRVLTWFLKDKNRVRMLSGGEQIVEHLQTGRNSDARSYGEWEAVSITPQGGIGTAKFDWKSIISTIAISGMEEAKNNGEEAILNLLEARVMQSEETLKDMLNAQLWGVSVAEGFPVDAATDVEAITKAIDATTVYGELDPATATYWASYEQSLAAVAETELRARLTTAYNTTAKGNDHVAALIGSQDAFELYESQLVDNVRYEDVKAANLGFTNLMFKGIPFYWDSVAPAGTILGINPKYVKLVGHKKRWFKQSKFTENPIDSDHATAAGNATFVDARFAVISAFLNLTVSNRQRHFKLTGIEAMV